MFNTTLAATTLAAQHETSDGTLIVLQGAPLSLFKAAGESHFEVRFSIGSFRYAGSTGCQEADLALMVAKATYASLRETLAEGEDMPAPRAA